jgi:CelD/BcsL family acetyltransferase involved in cellulose biosynthesis
MHDEVPFADGVLDVRVIDDYARFAALRTEWNRLASLGERRSVFLEHEWFDSAWQWLKATADLNVVCFYRGNELVGIAPLALEAVSVAGLKTKRARFLAVPDTQLADLVAPLDEIPHICRALANHLRATRRSWDSLELAKLPAGSRTLESLPAALRARGFKPSICQDSPNLLLRLDDTWERYYGRRSRRLKKGNNLVRNKLNSEFGSIRIVQWSSASAPPLLDDVIAVSSASWKTSTGTTLDQPGPRAFIERLTEHALRSGWLSVFVLYLDDKPAAAEYQLDYAGDIAALRADFVMELDRWSPGTYLNIELLRQLFGTGRSRYVMGPGKNAYKLRWAEQSEDMACIRAFSSTAKARILRLRAEAIHAAMALRGRLRTRAEEDRSDA